MNNTTVFVFYNKCKKSTVILLLVAFNLLFVSFITTTILGPGLQTPIAIGAYLNGDLPASDTGTPPQLLSETGAFSDLSSLTPNSGVIPYEMIEPFWSDGAEKSRWMAIPNDGSHNTAGEKIKFSNDGNWEFPIGAVLIKHFELGGKRLETRFEVRAEDGDYYYLSYKWNNAGTNATLLTTSLDETVMVNGQPQIWHYPSPTECLDCHKQAVGNVLGPKTRHLNHSINYPSTGLFANQLVTLSHLGIIDEQITDTNADNYIAVAAHDDLDYSLEYRARSYIDVNCSYCHQPATNIGQFDARITTPLNQQNILNGPVAYDLGLTNSRVIVPQDINLSTAHRRMNSLEQGIAMPPLAKNVVHQEGVQLIANWINSISIDNNNSTPIAIFNASALSGNAPLFVDFDAASSYDPDNSDLIYSWDFGDENVDYGVNTSHTYINPGTYTAVLTVNDGQNIGQETVNITVGATTNTSINFIDRTNLLLSANYSGVAMSVVDMNGDGKDDIVRYNNARSLNIQYQKGSNQAFEGDSFGNVSIRNQWSNSIADVNRDGFNDIMTSGYYDGIKIIYNNSNQTFTSSTIANSEIFIQGSNFVDIDNDGEIDAFACHDEDDSREFRNNGDGTFTFSPNMINTTTNPTSDNSGNYASIWTDYDNDGDIDLYISKCRVGVSSHTDPRRVNMLFQNDGNNNYTEVAAEANLKIGAQTWLTDFGDIDNDGDMDCIVINHYTEANLMLNNGDGTFTDITTGSGLLPDLDGQNRGIQAFFRDLNNDGFVDLIVSGVKHYLFYNDGDGTFTKAANPFNSNQIESLAIGDLNHDGFLDIYAGYARIYNSPTDKQDRLFINGGNSNNFIAIQLEGVESNINGIGARVALYGSWGKQIREVRSGEGYGVMNSFTQHFGIGSASQITKVVVNWPSGTIDEIQNPNPNQFLKIIEGSSPVSPEETTVSCGGNTTITFGNGTITMSGPDQEHYFQIFDANWNQVYNCGWQCGSSKTVTGYAPGEYRIYIKDSSYDVICSKVITLSNGGTDPDNDGDGVPASQDCDDSDANLTTIGASCNDGDTQTIDDVVQADCTCQGTRIITGGEGETTVSCGGNTTITYGNGTITMVGPDQEHYFQIFDASWNQVYNCGWQCGSSKTVTGYVPGEYRIYIKDSSYDVICSKVITLSNGGTDPDNDGDGVPASQDCNDSDANLTTIGASCNDGNSETTNDVVLSNCTCQGTTTGGGGNGSVVACGDATITYGEGVVEMVGLPSNNYYFKINDLDNGWSIAYSCSWDCGYQQTAANLSNGRYLVVIINDDWTEHCSVEIEMTNSSFRPPSSSRSAPQLNFEAYNAQRAVDLQWLTNSGYKVKQFEMERSIDGENFESLQKMVNRKWSEDLTSHQTTDFSPIKGISYYRVKEIYLDNSFAYTDIKQVGFNIDLDKLTIYPNPVEDMLSLSLKSIIGKSAKINIINAYGQVVQSNNLGLIKEEYRQIALNSTISNGFYHVWIEVDGQRPVIKKLIVKRLN